MKTMAALVALVALAVAEAGQCTPRGRGADKFWYQTLSDGPFYQCTTREETNGLLWGMLRAYRGGGTEGVHWKYTTDANDPACLNDWIYYAENGRDVVATVPGRTTTAGAGNRMWCGLPVYRTGGIQGLQWDYCECQ